MSHMNCTTKNKKGQHISYEERQKIRDYNNTDKGIKLKLGNNYES